MTGLLYPQQRIGRAGYSTRNSIGVIRSIRKSDGCPTLAYARIAPGFGEGRYFGAHCSSAEGP